MTIFKEALTSLILTDSRVLVLRLLRKLNLISWHAAAIQGISKKFPYYEYGLQAACEEASALGYEGITAIEFGVAGGNGLLALANAARQCEKIFGLKVQVVGFDSGQGMPEHQGYRDVPHMWSLGDFKMDKSRLREALGGQAQVILGNVSDTAHWWLESQAAFLGLQGENSAMVLGAGSDLYLDSTIELKFDLPIGFVSFDLDYWSSTKSALAVLGDGFTLPRVRAYFDDLDTISTQTGEWLAIDEFNSQDDSRFISDCATSSPSWITWAHKQKVFHNYAHPNYTDPLFKSLELPLR